MDEPQTFDPDARVLPPLQGDEATMLRAFLDIHRDTLRWKCSGLTQEQLALTLPPSDLTLGGMMKHLASVESGWFGGYAGHPPMPPFDTVDWDADPDWEWHTARDDTPEELRRLFDVAVRRSDDVIAEAMAGPGLDGQSVETNRRGDHFSLRRIMIHMLEEYARHNGHADLIRQSIDGQIGE
jgi:Protein of unknown function (DUF664)